MHDRFRDVLARAILKYETNYDQASLSRGRLHLLRHMAQWNMNLYVYAPKKLFVAAVINRKI